MKNKIFLDLDGVLCDFFGTTAKLCGKKKIKDLTENDVFGLMAAQPSVEEFFATLPEFKSNTTLIEKVLHFAGIYYICSSPLSDKKEALDTERNMYFIKQSIFGKHRWIQANLTPQPEKVCFSDDKWKDAPAVEEDGTKNILIDDRRTNVEDWIAAGGLALKFQADEHLLDPKLEIVDKFFKKIKKHIVPDEEPKENLVESYMQVLKGGLV